ncbi:MAG: hypothetical protein PHZ26_02185 [Candidatus Gracilibacteria bacterium]|nr:hypothetical protein [Candidatus Gracilibacteria bacterium]MDD2908543.1 hypothetical protein [Candidatus Gracilibacteria bacterium]
MFEIPVGDLLTSYTGDSKELEFNGEVYDGYYDDLKLVKNLELKIKIFSIDDGVSVIIENLKTQVKYGDVLRFIEINNIEREFREKFELINSDDIKYVSKNNSIDLKDVIREEILIQCID